MQIDNQRAPTVRAAQCSLTERASALRFIEALVAAVFDVSVTDLRTRARGQAPVAFARQAAMYLAHVGLGLNLSESGAHFGRDRTTVAHACRRVEDCRELPKFERLFSCLEAALDRWQSGFLTSERGR